MNDLIQGPARFLWVIASVLVACSSNQQTPADGSAVDAPIGNDVGAVDPANAADAIDSGASCPLLLQEPEVVEGKVIYWHWQIDWNVPNLKEICTTYGDDARLVVELFFAEGYLSSTADPPSCSEAEIQNGGLTKCMVAESSRFEFWCDSGISYRDIATMQKTLTTGYYHVESTLYPNPPRHRLKSDPGCPRSLSLGEGLPLPPPLPDGSVGCPTYPNTWRVDEAGRALWWSHFNWQQDDLASVCASYGPDAKMVIEMLGASNDLATSLPACSNADVLGGGTQACAVANSWRVETECTRGDLLFESPATTLGSPMGYYHIESAQVPDSPRRFVNAQSPCVRDARPGTGPVLSASALAVSLRYPEGGDAGLYEYNTLVEPAANGQPCRIDKDCPRPSQQICFIDAALTACPETPVGRCVANFQSNCILIKGCGCAKFYGATCASAPGYKCGHLAGCSACSLIDTSTR